MTSVILWKICSLTVMCSVFCLNWNYSTVAAIDMLNESESYDSQNSFENPEIWSPLLEELTINSSYRSARGLQSPYKYIPTSNIYINKRVDNLVPLGPSALKQNFNFNGASAGGPPSNFFNNRVPQNGQEVSETDLYLLSAIEKLVYRVDYMEKRLRKTEQLVYYLMAGNNEHKKEIYEKPCSMNFTRVGDSCYLFVVNQPTNWKNANSMCRSYGGHLAELDGLNGNNDMVAYLLNHRQMLNGYADYWLGGLNPGLLWIWSTSARPVNPNVNLTQIHNSTQSNAGTMPKVATKIENKKTAANKKGSGSTNTASTTKKPTNKSGENTKIITENDLKIEGNGRCLGMSYKADKHTYKLYGFECTSRQNFICELPEDHIDNEIDRIAKKLFS